MIREIVIPQNKLLTISVPDTMIGKPVEITIKEKTARTKRAKAKTLTELKTELKGLTVNMRGYKFDRDEANDYE